MNWATKQPCNTPRQPRIRYTSTMSLESNGTGLHRLPPEALHLITRLLSAREVCRVYLIGNRSLCRNLVHGGVLELHCSTIGGSDSTYGWPSAPLKLFNGIRYATIGTVTRPFSSTSSWRNVDEKDLSLLPRALKKLDLSEYNNSTGYHMNRTAISSLPPALTFLALPHFISTEELPLLPPNLVILDICCKWSPELMNLMPRTLETLKIQIRNSNLTPIQLPLSNWPPSLTSLALHQYWTSNSVLSEAELECFPAALVHLTLGLKAKLSKSTLSSLRARPLQELSLPHCTLREMPEDGFVDLVLPDTLTSFTLKKVNTSALLTTLIEALPSRLKSFTCTHGAGITVEHLQKLPRNLLYLEIGENNLISSTEVIHFPRSLTHLKYLSNTFQIDETFFRNLPRSLKVLDTWYTRTFAAVFPSLDKLAIPPALEHWISSVHVFQAYSLAQFIKLPESKQPSILQSLGYSLSRMTPAKVTALVTQTVISVLVLRKLQLSRSIPGLIPLAAKVSSSWWSWVLATYWALR